MGCHSVETTLITSLPGWVSSAVNICANMAASLGEEGRLLGFLILGLVAGLTHCSLMCGPLMLGLNGQFSKPGFADLLLFHAGRITTYVLLALIFAFSADFVFTWIPFKHLLIGPALLLAFILYWAATLPSLSRAVPLSHWIVNSGVGRVVSRIMPLTNALPQRLRLFVLGSLMGFVPCGLTLAILMMAAVLQPAPTAAVSLLLFGLGTSAGLFITTGVLASAVRRFLSPGRQAGLTLFSGLWLLVQAASGFLAA